MIPFPPSRASQKIAKNTTMHVCTYHHISAFISFASLSLSLVFGRPPAPSTVPPRVGRGSTRHTSPMDHAYVLCAAFPSSRGASEIRATGNPAAVVVVENDEEDDAGDFCRDESSTDDFQRVATSLNLSETAFVRRGRETAEEKERGTVRYFIRWFTPTCEIGLCGHASVASAAAVLSAPEHADARAVRFEYASGSLTIARDEDRFIMEMKASAPEAFEGCEDVLKEIRDAFETNRETVRGAKFSCTRNAIGDTFLLIEKTDEGDGKDDDGGFGFRGVVQTYVSRAPDLKRIARVGGRGVCVVIPACGERLSESEPDYVVRWFGPNVGIDEDPVTGSACCGVTPLLSARRSDTNSNSFMFGEQLSARTGHLWSRMKPDDAGKVQVAGRVIFTGEGIARHPYTT